ncbi:transmembrane protein 214 isoform X2 [Bufo gargarizans]|uniref:transmembrane protein 214 isoform X2 n=1 Tax=Bufo gargarizans TaxID=30331 RepID=UPI001CF53390|nr:transmembrane protein 214 isoform X2 [Bufo gargarizans]
MASRGAGDGSWKTVGKNKKNGDRRRALGENNLLPAASTAGVPIKPTIYEQGFETIMKKQNKEQVPPRSAAEPQNQKKPQQPSTSKSSKKTSSGGGAPSSPRKHATLEEAVRALDLAEFQRTMQKSLTMFPGNPQIWVKDLAGYLNDKLQTPKNEPVPSHQSHDYPYCLANKELRGIIRSVLVKAPELQEMFVDHCMFSMLQELDKPTAVSVHGYRICIQAVLLDKPKIVTANLKKYLDMLRAQQNKPAWCLALMWAVGQAGYADLTEGLKVWLGLMLPVLGIKSLSPFAISYLDRLLLMHTNLTKGFGMIGAKEFFPLLDFAFMPNNSLSASQQEHLRDLFPRLKVLAFGATPESTLHTYFPSFLSRATPNCPPVMKKELLHSLYQCLNLDPLSFSVWRQLYTKHLTQSSLLLQDLVKSWDKTSKLMRKSVRETAQSFRVTNEEFSKKSPNSREIAQCESACKAVLKKMKRQGFPWFRIFLVALMFASGFVIHDVRTHDSFEASSTAGVLQHTGLMTLAQQTWTTGSYALQQCHSWLQRNVPVYYSRAVEVLGPVLELLWEKSRDGFLLVSQKCSTQLTYLSDHLLWLIEWLQSRIPDSVFQLLEDLRELLILLYHNYVLPAVQYCEATLQRTWQQYVDSCSGEVTWDCTRAHLTNITQSSWRFLQNTTLAIKDWAVAMISTH